MIETSTHVFKIGAPAGYGVMTTGLLFAKMATRSGYDIFDYTEYPSLIQGGHNTYEIDVGSQVTATQKGLDLLVCLDQATFDFHRSRLIPGAIVLYDPKVVKPKTGTYSHVAVPWNEIVTNMKADKVMINTVALGAAVTLWHGNPTLLKKIIKQQFGKKMSEVAQKNIDCAMAGYEYITSHYPHLIKEYLKLHKKPIKQAVITGNDAFALGAVAGNCQLYAAYPMSPSSSVLASLAKWQRETGMVVRHAEDEIGVINEALGAAFTGARAAVGTSGGGFALMSESLSFAGVAELPLVMFVAQRPGPATGMPTWTEQGDLLFATYGGHGEFPRIVLTPGDVTEMVELTAQAFNLAAKYQLPVIVLSDKYLSECHQSVSQKLINKLMKPRLIGLKAARLSKNKLYKRYKITGDGVSPWLAPGAAGYSYQANSYEHSQDSHTSESAQDRIEQVHKRAQKIACYLKDDFKAPTVYGALGPADLVLVGWGSTKGALLTAQKQLETQGQKVAVIHFHHIYPLKANTLTSLFNDKKPHFLIENNSTGLLGQLLRAQTGLEIPHKLLKYNGRPIFAQEVVEFVKSKI